MMVYHTTIFRQMLQLFSRLEFQKVVEMNKATLESEISMLRLIRLPSEILFDKIAKASKDTSNQCCLAL